MEYIAYLAIAYFSFKLINFLIKYRNIYKLIGYKRVVVAGNSFIIKRLDPIDFIDDNGVPMTLFSYKKGLTLWEQVRGEDKQDEQKAIKERIELAKKMGNKAIIYPKNLNFDDLFDAKSVESQKIAWDLYAKILAHSFKGLTKAYEMTKNHALHIGQLCETFGKKPHEHIANPKKLSQLEKYMIDEFIFNVLIEQKNKEIEKMNRKNK